MLAKHALSQLSYGPKTIDLAQLRAWPTQDLAKMVGLGQLERPTSPLSGVRSNHLSYRPEASPRRSHDHAAGQRLILREERETRAAKSRIRDPDLGPIVPSESRGQARWTVAEDSSLERR